MLNPCDVLPASLKRRRAKLATIFPIKNPPSLRFLFSRLRTSPRERQEEVPEKGSLRCVGPRRVAGVWADGKIYSSQLPVEINKSHATRSRCAPTTAAIRVQGSLSLDIIAPLFAPGLKGATSGENVPPVLIKISTKSWWNGPRYDVIAFEPPIVASTRSPRAFPLCPGENIFPVARFRVSPAPSYFVQDPSLASW